MRNRTFVFALLAVVALGVGAGAARANTPVPAEPAATDANYRSPMREQCTAEIRKDADWRSELSDEIRFLVHDETSRAIAKNERHVILAYGFLLGLVALFVGGMFFRQQRLRAEIQRLEEELREAEQE